tara:strand:+ start:267 stop:1145 length:879 start_codon:yes stop_codon:yes gene_type:complete
MDSEKRSSEQDTRPARRRRDATAPPQLRIEDFPVGCSVLTPRKEIVDGVEFSSYCKVIDHRDGLLRVAIPGEADWSIGLDMLRRTGQKYGLPLRQDAAAKTETEAKPQRAKRVKNEVRVEDKPPSWPMDAREEIEIKDEAKPPSWPEGAKVKIEGTPPSWPEGAKIKIEGTPPSWPEGAKIKIEGTPPSWPEGASVKDEPVLSDKAMRKRKAQPQEEEVVEEEEDDDEAQQPGEDEQDVTIVGESLLTQMADFPHARENCPVMPFAMSPSAHCVNCYCCTPMPHHMPCTDQS